MAQLPSLLEAVIFPHPVALHTKEFDAMLQEYLGSYLVGLLHLDLELWKLPKRR